MIADRELTSLQKCLNYRFSDTNLLIQALTHRSAGKQHNQRLEFLGDAVLGMVVADELYHRFPDAPEGELSQRRARIVSRDTLASLARELKLGELLILGLGERKSGGRHRNSTLCDATEAVIGAVFVDGGEKACRACIVQLLDDHMSPDGSDPRDAKTRLQEMMQSRGLALPDYRTTAIEGEEHAQVFHVECRVALLQSATEGTGRSRRLAEQQAAASALLALDQLAGINRKGTQ